MVWIETVHDKEVRLNPLYSVNLSVEYYNNVVFLNILSFAGW